VLGLFCWGVLGCDLGWGCGWLIGFWLWVVVVVCFKGVGLGCFNGLLWFFLFV